jgi:TPP-dependent pyruvate/acetoin dehydrogenase alpha subunit
MHLCAPAQGLVATSAVVATTIPLAVGAALAHAYRNERQPVAVFFGDGAMEEGVFWESLNFACHRSLNILFVCEDNGLAIHASASERRGFSSISDVTRGFRCRVGSADGTDLVAVIEATNRLRTEMGSTKQPGFLHLRYFRFLEHVGINEDFSAGYRQAPSEDERNVLDPLIRFSSHLDTLGCTAFERRSIETQVEVQIQRSLSLAKEGLFPDAAALYEDVWV